MLIRSYKKTRDAILVKNTRAAGRRTIKEPLIQPDDYWILTTDY